VTAIKRMRSTWVVFICGRSTLAKKVSSTHNALFLACLACLLVGCKRGAVNRYELGFSDSIRAEFELGAGHVEHWKIDQLLRARSIGFVDGTMWSGSPSGADYTDLRVDLKLLNPTDLVNELESQNLILGNPIWFVNDVELKIARRAEQVGSALDEPEGG